MDYKQVAINKAKSLINSIPSEWLLDKIPSPEEQPNVNEYLDSILPENEKLITSSNANDLLHLQEIGKLTAYEITYAFCHRAALVHQLTNCCSEIFFDKAFNKAKELDDYRIKNNNKLIGKLHGIPISLKDQINLPQITTSIGYIAPHISKEFEKIITNRDENQNDISLIAEILQNNGAIFYVKTTVPMAMLGGETSSNLGTTLNSIDRNNSCGGSSGGEGALIGGKGSIIGIGTDIGGSIRIPSAVQGLFGLRGSSNRFPYLNIANSYPNQIGVCSVVGPMCSNINDLIHVSKVILNDPLCVQDPRCIPIKWRDDEEEVNDKVTNIGFLRWDGEILPHPPILNNIDKVYNILNGNDDFNCQIIDENKLPVKLSQLGKLLLSFYNCDNFTEISNYCKLSGEPLSELFMRSFKFKEDNRMDNVEEFFNKVKLKYEYQLKFDKLFNELNIDCFIMPSYSTVCWNQGDNNKISNFYTRSINVLDYTAMTFPVGKVNENDVSFHRDDDEFINEMDENNWKYFNLAKQLGKPVTLQLICKRYKEEECCRIVKKIIELL